ncbi:lipopolysaccharide transport periplasmic protein LptA [Albidovulum sp.]
MKRIILGLVVAASLHLLLPVSAATGQGTTVGFGGLKADTSQPVEVTADSLSVSQPDGKAVFSGNVVVVQGDMRLAADEVTVIYGTADRRKIESLRAVGNVTLAAGADAAEADEALYTIDTGAVVLTGNVLLTQGPSTLSGQRLTVDLTSGTGTMEGRVRTVLDPGTRP